MKQDLIHRFEDRTAKIAVFGLGYVGLPLAVCFAEAGFRVTGIDPDEDKVTTICRGESYIHDIPKEQVCRLVNSGQLSATTVLGVLRDVDAVSICVPTPLRKTGDPDLSYILAVANDLSPYMHRDMVVVLESTTYPGTTRQLLLPKLGDENGLTVGEHFYLAFSPERVDPGRKDWTTFNTPKVIGGITPACTEVAAALYSNALECVVPVSSTEVAEMSKLLENTFRMINIGLVNEMAVMCRRMGIDVWDVIEAAATKPFGFMKFTPGPGLGGHCIPIDPLYLSWKMRGLQYNARFIELASEINMGMPRYVVSLVQDALNQHGKPLKDSRVFVLGAAYKPDVDDTRESPAIDIIGLLEQKGALVDYNDPYIPEIRQDSWLKKSQPDYLQAANQADCVVIVTNHSCYKYESILETANLIVDTRNALSKVGKDSLKVVRL